MSTVLVVVEVQTDKEEAHALSEELEALVRGEMTRTLTSRPSANLISVSAIVKEEAKVLDQYIRQEVIKAKEKLSA